MFFFKKKIHIKLFIALISVSVFFIQKQTSVNADTHKKFVENDKIDNLKNKQATIEHLSDNNGFNFIETLYLNYENFAKDRYKHEDFIDAYYFKTKAEKIKHYKIISPADPYSFGILPDDIEQFIIAREQLKNVSINSIVNSNDGIVLADSYIAFDCWLEAFEAGNSQNRVNRCRDRFLDNIKAMRISLLMQGYNIFDISDSEELLLNGKKTNCESCILYKKGQYCNTFYFNSNETKMLSKMNIVIKRLEQKLSFFNVPTLTILYYKNSDGINSKLLNKRIDIMKNLLYNVISKDLPVKPIIKTTPILLKQDFVQKTIYKDAITICVSGNE